MSWTLQTKLSSYLCVTKSPSFRCHSAIRHAGGLGCSPGGVQSHLPPWGRRPVNHRAGEDRGEQFSSHARVGNCNAAFAQIHAQIPQFRRPGVIHTVRRSQRVWDFLKVSNLSRFMKRGARFTPYGENVRAGQLGRRNALPIMTAGGILQHIPPDSSRGQGL